jgi:TFIIF-interacting CTD phosphatase-like protein
LGRDLKYVILVDNLEHNFRLQKNNGVHVRSWYGDKNDDILKQIAE